MAEQEDGLLDVPTRQPVSVLTTHDTSEVVEEDEEEESSNGNGTVMSTAIGLSNNIVGAGILSLPSCFKEASVVEGAVLMVWVGVLSGLSMVLIAVCCDLTKCFQFRTMGEKTLGKTFGIVLQVIMLIYTYFSCVSFLILAGDFFSGESGIAEGFCDEDDCSSSFLFRTFNHRFSAVLVLTIVLLTPLSCLRDLNALRFTSLLSIIGMLYLFVLLVDEYFRSEDVRPPSSAIHFIKPQWGLFSAAPKINVAFIAHYNIPRFYQEMGDRSIYKFSQSVGLSLGLCSFVYIAVALFGYLRFGEDTKSDVLENFDSDYLPAIFGRLALSAVVLFTYPLAFNSLRASAIALLRIKFPYINMSHNKPYLLLTFALIAWTFVLGSTLDDIGVVLDYKGAILGGCISLAFPGWMFLAKVDPVRVQRCCIKPVQSDDFTYEQDEQEAHISFMASTSIRESQVQRSEQFEKLKRTWVLPTYVFFVWTIIGGIMGVVITTINL